MITRLITIFLSLFIIMVLAEFCGNNKIPFGLEVHKDGHLTLLCSRPNCHEKKYATLPAMLQIRTAGKVRPDYI
uniref:Uncharacterized protein n=1 Tax=Heterorhabditis bacteriophora TaxID=37862 RepID=A0A1I7XK87_HETBA